MQTHDLEYWRKWYSLRHDTSPTPFARRCVDWLAARGMREGILADVGCGNGRDSEWFSSLGWTVISQDLAIPPYMDAMEFDYGYCEVVYCRWFLHALEPNDRHRFIAKVAKDISKHCLFMAEFRSDKDEVAPAIQNHGRWPVSKIETVCKLRELGFRVLRCGERRGWSKVGEDDPLLIRVIAEKV